MENKLQDVEQLLRQGDTHAALSSLAAHRKKDGNNGRSSHLEQVALRKQRAEKLAGLGRFAEADSELAAVASLAPDFPVIESRRKASRSKLGETKTLIHRIRQLVAEASWAKVLFLADRVRAGLTTREFRERLYSIAREGVSPVLPRHTDQSLHRADAKFPEGPQQDRYQASSRHGRSLNFRRRPCRQ